MGHLFVPGGKTVDGDGVRELYVGNLARIRAEKLSEGVDYFALGHLHVPQKIDGKDWIRYCGSPIALGFEDAGQQKEVVIVEFEAGTIIVRTILIPKFRDIRTLKGDLSSIEREIGSLTKLQHPVWIEILFSGLHSPSLIQNHLQGLTEGTNIEILRIRPLDSGKFNLVFNETSDSLEDLSEIDVFQRRLDEKNIPIEERKDLTDAFMEILQEIAEHDIHA
jgi:DNA repair protein SbcD/Mre11